MQFIIRDDDLSYFTDIEEIDSLYKDIWNTFPITFATVPYQVGTALVGFLPLKHWHDTQAYPLGKNIKLIQYINEKISENKVDIALHGINHTYRVKNHTIYPELVDKIDDFEEKLIEAKKYLESLFAIDINTFVPPSNTMSVDIANILIKNNFNLLNLPGVKRNTRGLLSLKHQIARFQRIYYMLKYKFDSPIPIVDGSRWEVGGYALTPSTNLATLKNAFLYCKDNGYPFVLATHFWEHKCILPNDPKKTQYDLLKEFLDFVSKYDINPIRARDLKL
ncbi:DUF2334 domain-containing protein [Aliarcobacter butzleri]